MIGNLFYTPKNKRFNISPRYYDPDKEERDERERRIKEEMGIVENADDKKPFRSNMSGQFRNTNKWQTKTSDKARKASNKRLIVLILILSLLCYLLFFSDINLF
jgi:hypothetical protein